MLLSLLPPSCFSKKVEIPVAHVKQFWLGILSQLVCDDVRYSFHVAEYRYKLAGKTYVAYFEISNESEYPFSIEVLEDEI